MMITIGAVAFHGCKAKRSACDRGALLRLLDALAAWQMRHSYSAISRGQALRATITDVTQPSSVSERSSTSPCDR
jgi:ribonuclease PH